MLREEFEERTGFFPDTAMYEQIEIEYMAFDGDKDAFCKAYKRNKDGLAQKIMYNANMARYRAERAKHDAMKEHSRTIEELKGKIRHLEAALDKELEWQPYEDPHNVAQTDYDKLKTGFGTRELTDDEAKDIIVAEFGFDRAKIHVVHEVFAWERNRHSRIRICGMKERKPLYNATDWNYIAFDVTGNQSTGYEMHNGDLRLYTA